MEKPTTKTDERNRKLGQNMQYYRKEAHVTQKEMSEFCGVSKNHLSKIEQGVYKCPAHVFIDYGKKLNVSLDTLASYCKNSYEIIPELQYAISQLNATKQEALLAMVQALEKD